MQWQTADLLEIADVVAIHKADLPGVDRVADEDWEQLNLPGCREVPLVRASAHQTREVAELGSQSKRQSPDDDALV